jgi:hypothetical protein
MLKYRLGFVVRRVGREGVFADIAFRLVAAGDIRGNVGYVVMIDGE